MKLAIATYTELPNLADDDRLLVPELATHGIDASPVIWNAQDIDWTVYDAVLLRSTWDYHRTVPSFLAWADQLTANGIYLLNAPEIVRWNADKIYLRQLAAAGMPVIPTHWGTPESDLARVLASNSWDEVIIKPRHCGTSEGVWMATVDTLPSEPYSLDFHMVQPLMPQIKNGEYSLVYFAGEYSHTILKKAKSGAVFVQIEFGGTEEIFTADGNLIAQGRHILEVAAAHLGVPVERFTYVRVDGILVEGKLVLMELELIEPSLCLHLEPQAPAHFARAVAARLGRA